MISIMNKKYFLLLLLLNQSVFSWSNYCCDTSIVNKDTTIACSTFNENNRLISIEQYFNGDLHGRCLDWYDNGTSKLIMVYKFGKLIDTVFSFYPDGSLKLRGAQNGISVSFSEAGDTLGVTKMCNGKPCGRSRAWYPDKRLKSINNYNESGQKHGLCENWREDGTRRDSTVFENGKYVEERQYYTNGNIRHFNKYKNGVFWESYAWSPNGKPLEIIHNGTGKGTNYSEDGKTRYLREFKDGKEISCSIIPTED